VSDAPTLAQQASLLAQSGDDAAASALYEQGLERFPGDARFANSAGNFHARAGRDAQALELFERALALDPGLEEAAINAAIVLLKMNRPARAAQLLAQHETGGTRSARYWTMRANAERLASQFDEASGHYARALALDPANAKALAGQARLSLERGLESAVADYELALSRASGDAQLFHDYIQALSAAGRHSEALECSDALVRQLPTWIQGLILHAEMRWGAGERGDFTSHFAQAAKGDAAPDLYLAWAAALSGVDRQTEAAEVLAKASSRWPDREQIALSRAIALGEAGQGAEAEAIFAQFAKGTLPEWPVSRARNLLRIGRIEEAENLLATVIDPMMVDISAWALVDVCWRLLGDPRHEWLHGQPGLVREVALPVTDSEFASFRECLRELHRNSFMPIGQSVKQGSQTKGALFARIEPELARLKSALEDVLGEYRAGLPPADPTHPLLSHRGDPWAITGSWSIRLQGQGRHATHIHPRGLLSSACYFEVPEQVDLDTRPGWLELGRPPSELVSGLEPLNAIRPKPGYCALFPSTLFHGTRSITEGDRMTVAFDVTVSFAR